MTRAALVKSADLHRMAQIAKRDGVRVEIEINGAIVRVVPDIPVINKPQKIELPDDFAL